MISSSRRGWTALFAPGNVVEASGDLQLATTVFLPIGYAIRPAAASSGCG
jgi:hypothetical protein